MSAPGYDSYRDSGIDWLGEIPSHWDVKPIKAIASYNDDVLTEATPPDHEIDYVEISDVQAGLGIRGSTTYAFSDAPSRARRRVQDGDIIVSTVRTYLRAIAAITAPAENTVVSTGFAVIRPRAIYSRFIGYALLAEQTINQIIARSVGVSYPAINASDLVRIPVSVPPPAEQAAIAAFLDRETDKIDALVEAQTRLIELLKEKRQAVISHAVTKGLDPAAPMKDSGVEWLGQVPAHWEIMRLKQDLSFLTSGARGWAEHYAEEGPVFLRIGNLTRDSVDLDLADVQRVSAPEGSEGERTLLLPDDVVFSITAFLGSVAVIPSDFERAFVSQHVALARPRQQRLRSRWIAYVTLSSMGKAQFGLEGYGGTKVQLSLPDIANLVMTAPPIQEQDHILSRLEQRLSRLDGLISEAVTAVALLQERRAALISAAVTGKIDVRGLAPAQAEAA